MQLYLVRHAQTISNLKEINFNGKEDIPLTREGCHQSKRLAQELMHFRIDKIFISESKRSCQTLLPFLELNPITPQRDRRLNEADFGIFSGLTLREAKKKYPKVYQRRLKDKYNVCVPQGESYKDVAMRLDSFFKDLRKIAKRQKFQNVLIITHATPLKVFLIHFLGYSIEEADSFYFENASISIFDFGNRGVKPIVIGESSYLRKKHDSFKS